MLKEPTELEGWTGRIIQQIPLFNSKTGPLFSSIFTRLESSLIIRRVHRREYTAIKAGRRTVYAERLGIFQRKCDHEALDERSTYYA